MDDSIFTAITPQNFNEPVAAPYGADIAQAHKNFRCHLLGMKDAQASSCVTFDSHRL